ncbi:50S ribosomal protein L25/general stress protein Ctc [Mariniphaga sp.]|uniref:50S ribosomal protein L25/general stress protein Ctc n=1 Tax=Mariniphaga sp. TaxID=1954475 RepID=UPI003568A77A
MKSLKITGQKRENLGKKDAKKLREQGLVPGVLYGKDEVTHLAVPFSDLRPFVYTPNVYLIDLEIDGEVVKAMIQDVQWHPVEEDILHIDFLKIEAEKLVKIGVPVKLVGTAKGIKAGGKLKMNMRQLRVKALAENLPDTIEVDITKLGIGDSIKVGELQRENLEFLDNKSNLIVAVISTRVAKSAMMLPEDEEEEGAEGEVSEGEGSAETSETAESSEQ